MYKGYFNATVLSVVSHLVLQGSCLTAVVAESERSKISNEAPLTYMYKDPSHLSSANDYHRYLPILSNGVSVNDTIDSSADDDGPRDQLCLCNCTCTENSNRKLRLLLDRDEEISEAWSNNTFETEYCTKNTSESFLFVYTGADEAENTTGDAFCKEASNRSRRILYDAEKGGSCECVDDKLAPTCDVVKKEAITTPLAAISSFLSLFGSSWILTEILRDPRKRRLCYHRIMFGISSFDFLVSLSYLIALIDRFNVTDSCTIKSCTFHSCTGVGFFIYWSSLCIPLYNVALGYYFYMVVVGGYRDHQVREKFERCFHIVVPLVTFAIATAPLPLNLYNPYQSYCFPTFGGHGRGTVLGGLIFQSIFWTDVLLCTLYLACLMGFVYKHVLKLLRNSERHAFHRISALELDSTSSYQEEDSPLMRRVRLMALLYTIPFTVTWVIPVIWQVLTVLAWRHMEKADRTLCSPYSVRTIYIMQVWNAVCLPLQGFINWMIYMLPRFQKIRLVNSTLSFGQAFAMSLRGIRKPRQNRNIDSNKSQVDSFSGEKEKHDDDVESMIGDLINSIEESNSISEWIHPLDDPSSSTELREEHSSNFSNPDVRDEKRNEEKCDCDEAIFDT